MEANRLRRSADVLLIAGLALACCVAVAGLCGWRLIEMRAAGRIRSDHPEVRRTIYYDPDPQPPGPGDGSEDER